MIVGIGCDIVEHNITNALGWPSKPKKIERIFSSSELALSHNVNVIKFFSGRFAAKEAVLKSIGTGIDDGISLKDVEILKDDLGRPRVRLDGEVKRLSEKLRITRWHINISHTELNSIAFVIAETD